MKTVLSYCSARAFTTGLLPTVAMRPQHAVARNDNEGPLHLPRLWNQDGPGRYPAQPMWRVETSA
jgi:hypothetical protein